MSLRTLIIIPRSSYCRRNDSSDQQLQNVSYADSGGAHHQGYKHPHVSQRKLATLCRSSLR